MRYHVFRFRNRARYVTALQHCCGQYISLGVQARRIFGQRRFGREQRFSFFVFHFDQLNGPARRFCRGRGQHGESVAHVARLFAFGNHYRPVVDHVANQPLAGNVPGREHNFHAGKRARRRNVDLSYQRPRKLCAQHSAVQHSRNQHVVDKLTASQQLFMRVRPHDAFAHAACCWRCWVRSAVAERCSCQLNGALYFCVACAAAQIVADSGFHFACGWGGIRVEQSLGADQHAGHAESALHGAYFAEGPRIYFALARREAFARGHRFALDLGHGERARAHRFAIHDHGAGAADAFSAAVLH